MARSKKQKIVRRTVTGVALAASVAGFFLVADRFPEYRPILVIASLLQLACAIEVGRMGSLAGRGFTLPLVLAALAVVAPVALDASRGVPTPAVDLPSHVAFVLLAAWFVRALGDFARAAGLPSAVVPLVWLVAVGALAYLGTELKVVLAVFGVVALVSVVLAVLSGRGESGQVREGPSNPRRDLVVTIALAAWILVPLSMLPMVWERTGARGMLTLILLSKVGDIAGYFVGSAIGKHHPFKNLSPGKTTEGCLGSLVAGALVGGVLFWAGWIQGDFARGMLIGAVLNIAAQAGDLLESKVKRTTGVKDSSTWLGASGGFLDVVDSLLLTVPTMMVLWPNGF